MKPTQKLHDLGQSLWVDNITREMLRKDVLKGYIEDLSVTGLTSNPSIFEKAIGSGEDYDEQVAGLSGSVTDDGGPGASSDENVFFELALADLRDAADLFADTHTASGGVDGFVSLEVSPLLADDTEATIKQAAELHAKAERRNLYIKIPGTPAGLPAIEESIFAGIPINVTLLFDDQQYLRAADAYMKGIERRIEAGLDPVVQSVASIFMSRWDVAVTDEVPAELKNRLGIAIGGRAYRAYRELLDSDRWMRLANSGARAQRLLWASTGTKDPEASDTLYIEAFASPFTVNTMPDKTLEAFADHGEVGDLMDPSGGNSEQVLKEFEGAGIDLEALAKRLQDEGKDSFDKSWNELLKTIADKRGVTAG
jgi:transaldolase